MWRESKNKNIHFCSGKDFKESAEIPQEVRDSYKAYTETTDPATLKVNDKGYIDTDWHMEDKKNVCQYRATYNPEYGFGVMKLPAAKASSNSHTKDMLEKMDKKINVLALHFGIKFDA